MTIPKFYAVGEQERLYATCIEDAVQEYIDRIDPDPVPEYVDVQGYAPRFLDPSGWPFDHALESILEDIGDEYACPDKDYPKPTEAMKKAMDALVAVIVKEYDVWQCEQCGKPIRVAISFNENLGILEGIKILS